MKIQLKVNGRTTSVDAPPNTLLVHALREELKLTGTHVGCDTAQCGACTVIVNGRAIKSCNTLVAQHPGAEVTTIEGLASADGTLHPMQAAFKDCHGLQCGFCTPGMVMSDFGQSLPMHRVPEHRQSGSAGQRRHAGRGRIRSQSHGCIRLFQTPSHR